MADRFEGVDLSTSSSLKRMARTIVRQRAEMIGEMIELLSDAGESRAADLLREKVRQEAAEVENG